MYPEVCAASMSQCQQTFSSPGDKLWIEDSRFAWEITIENFGTENLGIRDNHIAPIFNKKETYHSPKIDSLRALNP